MATLPHELLQVVAIDPVILGGTPCFKGTRVPLATFLDHVQSGISLDRFLEGYPTVDRQQAFAVLNWFATESRRLTGLELEC